MSCHAPCCMHVGCILSTPTADLQVLCILSCLFRCLVPKFPSLAIQKEIFPSAKPLLIVSHGSLAKSQNLKIQTLKKVVTKSTQPLRPCGCRLDAVRRTCHISSWGRCQQMHIFPQVKVSEEQTLSTSSHIPKVLLRKTFLVSQYFSRQALKQQKRWSQLSSLNPMNIWPRLYQLCLSSPQHTKLYVFWPLLLLLAKFNHIHSNPQLPQFVRSLCFPQDVQRLLTPPWQQQVFELISIGARLFWQYRETRDPHGRQPLLLQTTLEMLHILFLRREGQK